MGDAALTRGAAGPRGGLEALLKRLRAWTPLNRVATHAVRAGCAPFGGAPELVVRHLHRFGPVSSRLPNGRRLRLWSLADDWVSNLVFWRGWRAYEPETAPLFFRLAARASLTLDVGAYVGFYSLLAGHANPEGRVLAFEPLPAIHERLRGNVARNRLDNVACVAAAAGREDGRAALYHVSRGLPSSSSLSRPFMGTCDVTATPVEVVRLDRLLAERGVARVDLVKIDTESTEPDVLAGMREVLGRDRPTIVCEVLAGRGSEAALTELLAPLGYAFHLLTPSGPVRRQRVEGHPAWLNYIFSVGTPWA